MGEAKLLGYVPDKAIFITASRVPEDHSGLSQTLNQSLNLSHTHFLPLAFCCYHQASSFVSMPVTGELQGNIFLKML